VVGPVEAGAALALAPELSHVLRTHAPTPPKGGINRGGRHDSARDGSGGGGGEDDDDDSVDATAKCRLMLTRRARLRVARILGTSTATSP
jgi:hypothetical protein